MDERTKSFRIEVDGDRARVFAPFNPDYGSKLKRFGGRFDHSNLCWNIKAKDVERARKAMRRSYGRDDLEAGEEVTLLIHIKSEISRTLGCVIKFGKVLAIASGRDSGAEPGPDVAYVKGYCQSGGSRNYWASIVTAGSVVKLLHVPKEAVDKAKPSPDYDVEIIDAKQGHCRELESRKAALLNLQASTKNEQENDKEVV